MVVAPSVPRPAAYRVVGKQKGSQDYSNKADHEQTSEFSLFYFLYTLMASTVALFITTHMLTTTLLVAVFANCTIDAVVLSMVLHAALRAGRGGQTGEPDHITSITITQLGKRA